MPTYTIFAGVNGCGKTSIYKSVYYEENKDKPLSLLLNLKKHENI